MKATFVAAFNYIGLERDKDKKNADEKSRRKCIWLDGNSSVISKGGGNSGTNK